MNVTVLLFGPAAKAAGSSRIVVKIDGPSCTCRQLQASLLQIEPCLQAYAGRSRWAVNHAFASDDAQIAPGDEVALIAAVSGG